MIGRLPSRALLYALVLLGVTSFAVANETLDLIAFGSIVLVVAWLVSGNAHGRPLPTWLINSLLVAATGYLVLSLRGPASEYIGAIATFLTGLQLIKLFDVRQPRDQAQIISLSVMLAIGSCLTSVTIDLAAILVLYVPALLLTVILHHLDAGAWAAADRLRAAAPAGTAPASPPVARGRRYRRHLARMTISSGTSVLLIAVFIFIVMPRGVGGSMFGRWQPPRQGATVGFNDHVKLGGVSGILNQSQRIVMEVRVTTEDEAAARRIGSEPWYLRGMVLNEYDPRSNTWRRSREIARQDRDGRWRRAEHHGGWDETLAAGRPFNVHISMRNRQVDQLFTTWMPRHLSFHSDESSIEYRYSDLDGVYLMTESHGPIEYEINSFRRAPMGFDNTGPRDVPLPESTARFQNNERFSGLAADILSRFTREQGEGLRRAAPRIFEGWLRDNCRYTTELMVPRPGQDPIEMFLFDEELGRRGHCEYFAAAHAALCQSIGINARVIAGYVATDYDTGRGLFIVRESNAHAWVEAEIAPGQWREYDPSPSDAVLAAQRTGSNWRDRLRELLDAIELAWVENVVRYDSEAQAETLGANDDDPLGMYSGLQRLADHFGLSSDRATIRNFISALLRAAGAGAMAFGALALVLFIARSPLDALIARLLELLRIRRRHVPAPGPGAAPPFYIDMLRHLDYAGLAKPAWRPPRDHARTLRAAHRDVASQVEAITDLYYDVRFAGRPLDDDRARRADAALRALLDELGVVTAETREHAHADA